MKPVIYTFGYSGWGPHVLLMKEAFIRHNMAVRGRSLKWLDTRLKRSVRAMGFRDNKPEELLGREHYRWIPEFGNVAIERGGRERLKDFEKGLDLEDELKVMIYPERTKVKNFRKKIKELIDSSYNLSAFEIIKLLNPVLRG